MVKTCTTCKLELTLASFNKRSGYNTTLPECKGCWSIRNKKYVQKMKENKDKKIPKVKICRCCKIEKKAEEFHRLASRKDGITSLCKSCVKDKNEGEFREQRIVYGKKHRQLTIEHRRDYSLKKSYGVSLEYKKELFDKQEGKCSICLSKIEDMNKSCIDHDHKTRKIRELLCRNCNSGIGLLKEDPEILMRASSYLIKYKESA